MKPIKAREAIRQLEMAGFRLARQPRGSHAIYEKIAADGRRITVVLPVHDRGDEISGQTWRRIRRDAGLV
jgi:predicted RNA binding protein YcfA (HicA-like mRNA interferase family)